MKERGISNFIVWADATAQGLMLVMLEWRVRSRCDTLSEARSESLKTQIIIGKAVRRLAGGSDAAGMTKVLRLVSLARLIVTHARQTDGRRNEPNRSDTLTRSRSGLTHKILAFETTHTTSTKRRPSATRIQCRKLIYQLAECRPLPPPPALDALRCRSKTASA